MINDGPYQQIPVRNLRIQQALNDSQTLILRLFFHCASFFDYFLFLVARTELVSHADAYQKPFFPGFGGNDSLVPAIEFSETTEKVAIQIRNASKYCSQNRRKAVFGGKDVSGFGFLCNQIEKNCNYCGKEAYGHGFPCHQIV